MKCFLTTAILGIILIAGPNALAVDDFLNIDSFGCVVLYSAGNNATDPSNPVKPVWYADVYDYSYDTEENVSHYLDEISFGNLTIDTVDAYPQEEEYDGTNIYDIDLAFTGYGSTAYYTQLLDDADDEIDFSDYDITGPAGIPDGVVDVLVVNMVGYGAWNGWKTISLSGGTYETDDDVDIDANNTFVCKIYGVTDNSRTFREKSMNVFTHELGHLLARTGGSYTYLRDTDHSAGGQYHMGAGAFGRMNNNGDWESTPSPINPYLSSGGSNDITGGTVKQGVDWITPTDITSNQSNYTIDKYFQDEALYRIRMDSGDYPGNAHVGQTFLIARYANGGATPPYSISSWPIPGNDAILIWHTNAEGVAYDWRRKWADVEAAHGLYDWEQDTGNPTYYGIDLGTENPISGSDSLDWKTEEYDNDMGNENAGSGEYFYCEANNTAFLPHTNPNSNYSVDSSPYAQSIFTNLGISDISYSSGTGDYTADIWIDAPPQTPQNFDLSTSGGHPYLTWDANTETDLDHYVVHRFYREKRNPASTWTTTSTTTNNYWTDTALDVPGGTIVATYKVKAVDEEDNESAYTTTKTINGTGLAWKAVAQSDAQIPELFSIGSAYPNPFNPSTVLQFAVPTTSDILIDIINIKGQLIQRIEPQLYYAGYHEFIWTPENTVEAGVYLMRVVMTAIDAAKEAELPEQFNKTQKITYLR
ncbi:hypothetical protein HQ531_06120 [bacterium]|nr:hypothetical protein [bacterium]